MHKIVYGVFKALAISMILVFVFDEVMYLYKAIAVDQRMKNIMASMQETVSENNFLPESAYDTYVALFQQVAMNMNGDEDNSFIGTSNKGSRAIFLNYKTDAHDISPDVLSSLSSSSLLTKMYKPAAYGDVMVVQAQVILRQPTWDFVSSGNTRDGNETVGAGGERGAAAFQNDRTNNTIDATTAIFSYTYYVPCMNYSKNTNN